MPGFVSGGFLPKNMMHLFGASGASSQRFQKLRIYKSMVHGKGHLNKKRAIELIIVVYFLFDLKARGM